VATGGLPHHNPLLVEICADVLGKPITIHPAEQGPALGAAILGAVAAGGRVTGFRSMASAIEAMAGGRPGRVVQPERHRRKTYESGYRRYRMWCDEVAKESSLPT
jgi:L-ribulokinase